MSREAGDSPRTGGLSRRQLLASVTGIGAVGMASGLGTGAYLADRETFENNGFGAGTVELLVNGTATSGTLSVDVSDIDRGDSGTERYEIGAQTNPVRIWLATECVASDALSRALEVDVRVDGASITGGHLPLAEVGDALVDGERLDDGCLDPEDTVLLEIDWRLPADVPDSLASADPVSLTFQLYAEQCRHIDESDAAAGGPTNPFAGRVCEATDDCPTCVEFGKADDIDGSLAVGDVISLDELPPGVGAHEIEITAVETKDDGEAIGAAFVLRDAAGEPGPDMCAVEIKGGPGTERHGLTPPSPEADEILFAPSSDQNDGRYGISHIVVFVCAREGEYEVGDTPGAGNSGNSDDDTPGAGNGRNSDGENDDSEAN
jgi:predicted ribosomally synthesized peptide with SipW-like signal peptide